MLCVMLFFVVQGLWSAAFFEQNNDGQGVQDQDFLSATSSPVACIPPPPYKLFPPLRKGNNSYVVTVKFRSMEERLYQVRWDVFGQVFNGSCSIGAVLERSLLMGRHNGLFVGDNKLDLVGAFTCPVLGLKAFLASGDCLSFRKSRRRGRVGMPKARLCEKQLSEMFPADERKMWKVQLSPCHQVDELKPGEVRVLLDAGCLSCLPTPLQWKSGVVLQGSARYAQMVREIKTDFVEKVRYYAKEKKDFLQEEAQVLGKNVYVRYVNGSGEVLSAQWDGSNVFDATDRDLFDFLQDNVLLGCNLGYVDEDCEEHYAFTNDCLRDLLQKTLGADLERKENVSFNPREKHLTLQALLEMPYMGWTVVESEHLRRPEVRHSCAIVFPGATLEGVPRRLQVPMQTHFLPRNFLWADCYDQLIEQYPGASCHASAENPCWYTDKLGVNTPRLLWVCRD